MATLILVIAPLQLLADLPPTLTPHERVERLATPEACACWFYQPWDPAAHGPPRPPRTAWQDETLEQVYATMIASLRLHPELASLLHYFLIEEMTAEERGIVVPARARPVFEEYLDRWVDLLGSLQSQRLIETCDLLMNEVGEAAFRHHTEQRCRSVPRSIAHIAFSLRTGALHYFRNLDQAWETPVQQEARRQQDELIALVERLFRESPAMEQLSDELREAVLGEGIEEARRRMRGWFDDPFLFLAHKPVLPGDFDQFLAETANRFEDLLALNLDEERAWPLGGHEPEGIPIEVRRMKELLRLHARMNLPAEIGSSVIHHYVSSPRRRWNPNDQQLFPLGAPQSISTSTKVSRRWRYPPVEMRETLLPADGLEIVLQHPEVLGGDDVPDLKDHTDRFHRILLPDPSLKAAWCEVRYTRDGVNFNDYTAFTHLDFLDGRRNPR